MRCVNLAGLVGNADSHDGDVARHGSFKTTDLED